MAEAEEMDNTGLSLTSRTNNTDLLPAKSWHGDNSPGRSGQGDISKHNSDQDVISKASSVQHSISTGNSGQGDFSLDSNGQGDSKSDDVEVEDTAADSNAGLLYASVETPPNTEGMKSKRPPRSERKRRRHEELLQKRREDRKRKKTERKMRLKEQRSEIDDNEDRLKPSELKEERRNRCRQAMKDGQRICIDCSLEEFMSEKGKGKLAMQIGRLYGSNLRADIPAHIYLTGLKKGGLLQQECIKKMDGFENYLIDTREEAHSELFPLHQIICLSPDSENLLTDIDPEKVYVIGGLVDENIKQHITESRATDAGIKTARLPIEENMEKVDQSSHSQVLAVNQVFDILITYMSTKDWKQALAAGVPRRKGYVIKDDHDT